MAYDLFGDGKTVLKASWGRYNHSPGDAFADAYNRNTISTTTYRWSDPNRNGDYDPGEVNLDTNGPDFVTITAATNNLLPQDSEGSAHLPGDASRVDRELMANFAARVSYIYVHQADPYQTINVLRPYELYSVQIPRQDPGGDGLVGTPDDGAMVTVWDYPAQYRGSNFVGNQRVTAPDDRDTRLHTIEGVFTKRTVRALGDAGGAAASKNDRFLDGIATTPNQELLPEGHDVGLAGEADGQLRAAVQDQHVRELYAVQRSQGRADVHLHRHSLGEHGDAPARTVRSLPGSGSRSAERQVCARLRHRREHARLRGSVEVLNALNSVSPWSMTFASGPNFLYWGTIDSPRIARGSVTFMF